MTRWWFILLITASLPLPAFAQDKRRDAVVIYKDGFRIEGKVKENVKEFIYDSASGRGFPILGGDFYIDDHVRNIVFSPANVLKVIQPKPGEVKDPPFIVRIKAVRQPKDVPPPWIFDDVTPWDNKGIRHVQLATPTGTKTMQQKIGFLTPRYLHAVTDGFRLNPAFFPQEFSAGEMRVLLLNVFSEVPEFRKLERAEKFIRIAAFLHEAGWFEDAERELKGIIGGAFPGDRKVAQEMLAKVQKQQAEAYVEGIDRVSKAGQHNVAVERLLIFERRGSEKIVSAKHRIKVSDLKAKYAKAKTDLAQARALLELLPPLARGAQKTWGDACATIAADLNYDTLDRLDTFLFLGEQFESNRKSGKKQQYSAEKIMALAVSGWLQGEASALTDDARALLLWQARAYILAYLRSGDEVERTNLLSKFRQNNNLEMDVLSKLIALLPPPFPHDAKDINTDVQEISIQNGGGESYLLKLPPDYHHLRAYPTLILLNSGRETAAEVLERFAGEGANHGFILAAPLWHGNNIFKRRIQPGDKERAIVRDTLHDLRRRLNVDSDRVFLFGREDGATLAFDVGLGNPDQYAGVVSMCAGVPAFTRHFYWPNAQYLPFYVIEGEKNGGNAKAMRDMFKKWSHEPFASLYVEYMGRASEWYVQEIPWCMDWMSRKKRHHPRKEMGVPGGGFGVGEEFQSTRNCDTRFYWLSSRGIDDVCAGDHHTPKWRANLKPAHFQARLSVGNKMVNGNAKIWNHASIRIRGHLGVTLWITPDMMDLKKPLVINVNGNQLGGMRTIEPSLDTLLGEVHRSGDRQRLFVAKVEIGKN